MAGALAGERVRPVVLGLAIPEPAGKISLAGYRDALLATAGLTASSVASRVAPLARARRDSHARRRARGPGALNGTVLAGAAVDAQRALAALAHFSRQAFVN